MRKFTGLKTVILCLLISLSLFTMACQKEEPVSETPMEVTSPSSGGSETGSTEKLLNPLNGEPSDNANPLDSAELPDSAKDMLGYVICDGNKISTAVAVKMGGELYVCADLDQVESEKQYFYRANRSGEDKAIEISSNKYESCELFTFKDQPTDLNILPIEKLPDNSGNQKAQMYSLESEKVNNKPVEIAYNDERKDYQVTLVNVEDLAVVIDSNNKCLGIAVPGGNLLSEVPMPEVPMPFSPYEFITPNNNTSVVLPAGAEDMLGNIALSGGENLTSAIAVKIDKDIYLYANIGDFNQEESYFYTSISGGESLETELVSDKDRPSFLNNEQYKTFRLKDGSKELSILPLEELEDNLDQKGASVYGLENGEISRKPVAISYDDGSQKYQIKYNSGDQAFNTLALVIDSDSKALGIVAPDNQVYTIESSGGWLTIVLWVLAILAGLLILLLIFRVAMKTILNKNEHSKTYDFQVEASSVSKVNPNNQSRRIDMGRNLEIGKVHNIGRRASQQDCLGSTEIPCGLLAVVADGMGGLQNSEQVSEEAVMSMLREGANVRKITSSENPLFKMLSRANQAVNDFLGPAGIMKSGSTLVAAIISEGYLQWVSVGDSRICLYRNKGLVQLNIEHNKESELILEAVNNEIPFSEIKEHRKKQSLTSFLGMGNLKYVDGSRVPIQLQRGDKLLLMSDGIYNTLSDSKIIEIIANSRNAAEAASEFERQILQRNEPKQDNFTAIIINV